MGRIHRRNCRKDSLMPAGRPTKYRKKHCHTVIAVMKEGKSLVAVAKEIGVSRKILNDWQLRYPEFREACNIGKDLAQEWWERLAVLVATGKHDKTAYKKANHGMIQFLMSRRFSDYYQKNQNYNRDETLEQAKDPISEMTKEERLEAIKRYKIIIETLEGQDD